MCHVYLVPNDSGRHCQRRSQWEKKMLPAGENMLQYAAIIFNILDATENRQGMTICQNIKHRSNTQTCLECAGKHNQVVSKHMGLI